MAVGESGGHGRGEWRRFVGRGVAISAVALPVAFALGYASGGLALAVGACATTAGCIAIAATVYAFRYLRRPPKGSGDARQ